MNRQSIWQILGPGLLYAGAAVGVSHLVQSTKAGAQFGWQLIGVIIIAHILKYPFFEFAPRYVAATGKSLLDGYRKLGRGWVWAFLIMTLLTLFTIQAAVTMVTAGLAQQIIDVNFGNTWSMPLILLVICGTILVFGRYSVLDNVMKGVIILLSVSTLVAFVAALFSGGSPEVTPPNFFEWGNSAHILFLAAFFGWMPAPIDVSVWHSVWAEAKNRTVGRRLSLKESLVDFKVGFFGTAVLAFFFLGLGALMLYRSGETLSPNGSVFAGQLISVYTNSLGPWAWPVISIAALTTMFSTTLSCLDAFPRVLAPVTRILFPALPQQENHRPTYLAWLLVTAIGALVFLTFFISNMKDMVTLATVLSFLTAPVLAYMNYRVVTSKEIESQFQPGSILRVFSWIGIIGLSSFALFFLVVRFG